MTNKDSKILVFLRKELDGYLKITSNVQNNDIPKLMARNTLDKLSNMGNVSSTSFQWKLYSNQINIYMLQILINFDFLIINFIT